MLFLAGVLLLGATLVVDAGVPRRCDPEQAHAAVLRCVTGSASHVDATAVNMLVAAAWALMAAGAVVFIRDRERRSNTAAPPPSWDDFEPHARPF